MKSIRCLLILFAIAGFLVAQSGCGTQPPPVTAPTSRPVATELAEIDPVQRVLSAVQNLEDPRGFSYDVKAKILTHMKVTVSAEVLNEGSHLESVVDRGVWSRQGDQVNVAVKRNVSYPASQYLYPLNGEIRLVDGQVYARAAFDQPKAELPAMPEGWIRVNGQSTLMYWPNIQELALRYSLRSLQEGPWSLITGSSTEVLEDVLSGHLETAQYDSITFEDGSAGELLTFAVQSSALEQAIYYLGEPGPADEKALASVRGSPIEMKFTLDEASRLVEWELAIKLDVQDVDLTGTPGFPDGAQLDGRFEQNVAARLWRDPLPAVVQSPAKSELLQLSSYSGQDFLFPSLEAFDIRLNRAIAGGDSALDTFWQELSTAKTMPLVFDDLAVFLYREDAGTVDWISDWSYSRPSAEERLDRSNLWMHTVRLPADARLEYQIQVDGEEPVLDSLNPAVETGGLGSKSVVEMPEYTAPEFLRPQAGIAQGTLTEDIPFSSQRLGYDVNYRVYLPAEYAQLHNLPVLYVTDGQDFLAFGRLAAALDTLIGSGRIQPAMAVFIDPRDLQTGENQRNEQFFDNPPYGQFIAEELVPEIDRLYRTDRSPDARLIIGTSNGGYHSLYFALNHANTFHLIAAFSPSIWHNPEIIETYRAQDTLPLKFFITTGVFNDSEYHARQFRDVLQGKGYPLLYLESNEGHSYGNWRGKFDEMLEFFFPGDSGG